MRTLVTAAGTHDTCNTCRAEQLKIHVTCFQYVFVRAFLKCPKGKVACPAAPWQQQSARCACFRNMRIGTCEDLLIALAMLQHKSPALNPEA